jgi:uncharacterized protein YjbI with pentapeptide repeats
MSNVFVEDKEFNGINYLVEKLPRGEYEQCTFLNCDFSGSDLSGTSFVECQFKECNLSMAKVANTAFKEVRFKACKLVGLHFDSCNPFLLGFLFEGCQLNLSSFYRLTIKKTRFLDCSLQEVDFAEADLSQSQFINCDLTGAIFDRTNLEKADFRTSYNYAIDPENNRLKKAKFSLNGVAGLLGKYNIEISS